MAEKKYSKADAETRIEEFLDMVLDDADFDLTYDISGGEGLHPDFENPDVLVRFSGPDVDLLLGNKAELLLAMEQLATEALRMAPEEHSLLCFDANDHRMLRIQELRMSAMAAAERTHAIGEAVDHDVATGIDPGRLGGRALLFGRVTDPERAVIAAGSIVEGDAVCAFGDEAVALLLLGCEAAAAERDAKSAYQLAVAIGGKRTVRLVDQDAVDRSGGERIAAVGAIIPCAVVSETAVDGGELG